MIKGTVLGATLELLTALTLCVALGCQRRTADLNHTVIADSIDPRTPVTLPPEGQQAVLLEMRQLLGAMGGALAGAASDDTTAVLAALAPAGSAAAADPALEALLPAAWKDLAERTHTGFDRLAIAIRLSQGSGLKDSVLQGLARLSGACTSCHATYRIAVR
jgi:cytochrome c556